MISGWRTGFVVWLAMVSSSCAANRGVMPEIVGHWQGGGKIIVTWCQQTNLPLALEIKGDGTVTGKVGDATLTKGRFRRNRGWLGKKLNIKTDYIITGSLEGPIVAAEGIVRSGVKIPVNNSAGKLVGGIHTTGSKFGGKKRMILSASLNLAKTSIIDKLGKTKQRVPESINKKGAGNDNGCVGIRVECDFIKAWKQVSNHRPTE